MSTKSEPAEVITIDGPTASGKGTVSRLVAERLGWNLLDSGALYRLVALSALRQGVDLADEPRLMKLARELDARFVATEDNAETAVLLEGEDVSLALRHEQTGNAASKVAALGGVRNELLARQRAFCQPPGLVADGRDMGTVVFPGATHKFFITASAEERAKRRYKQLMEKGIDVSLSALFEDIAERDRRDSERKTAPLKPAVDAFEIDTSQMNIQQVVETILTQCQVHT